MADFKLVIGDPKTKKSYQRVVNELEAKPFLGKVIGNKIKGDTFGLSGYEFEITGGSDHCGFPMRRDVVGTSRKRILTIKGTGAQNLVRGIRVRKNVAGNTIHSKISQINLKILKHGKQTLKKAAPTEETKGEDKKE